ncbi:hypothetical protein DPM35_00170 [Mesorhizobium atlanticum]|uniref:Uncharacterized protein n=1 Tax=Mesorhizobium atlanticum TaxID=2233532 RepID=A0A330GX91_9HYPH|nr:hypothetical protein DPM35_00170 [Mesorhizobium atlanticum]
MISPLDVILIHDGTITPPGPKLVVCIHPGEGWYYRINSKNHWKPAVAISRDPHHGFLDHDSFLECGDPLELDDYVVEESIRYKGIIGHVSPTLCAEIVAALKDARYLKEVDKDAIRAILGKC